MNKALIFVFLFSIIRFNSKAICFADSIRIKKNSLQLDIGGVGNIAKISYSRNIFLTNKFIIAPRIGFSTLGVDFKMLGKKRIEFVVGCRFLLIFAPTGFSVGHKKSFYERYKHDDGEGIELSKLMFVSNYIGFNYHFKSTFVGSNVSIHSMIYNDYKNYSGNILSPGLSVGYKF